MNRLFELSSSRSRARDARKEEEAEGRAGEGSTSGFVSLVLKETRAGNG